MIKIKVHPNLESTLETTIEESKYQPTAKQKKGVSINFLKLFSLDYANKNNLLFCNNMMTSVKLKNRMDNKF